MKLAIGSPSWSTARRRRPTARRGGVLHWAAVAVLTVVGLGACASDEGPPAADGTPSGTVSVYAASSLTEAFTAVARRFEELNPGSTVELTFNGSSALATQIAQGAPADVFAAADTETMARLVDDGLAVGPATIFARNRLAIVVAQGNPLGIGALADLARDDIVTIACASDIPCGRYADAVLAAAGVEASPRSRELNVKAVVARVALGEADAGIVYATDVMADERVDGVAIAEEQNLVVEYPVVVLREAATTALAQAFVSFLTSPDGQAALAERGFLTP